MRDHVLAIVLLATLACLSAVDVRAADGADTLRATLERTHNRLGEALARRDLAGMVAVYRDHARLIPPGEPDVAGRVAIASYWQAFMDSGARGLRVRTLEATDLGDTAIERGVAGAEVPGPNGQFIAIAVKYLIVWRREADGSWRIAQDIWNAAPPTSP
jgi:uncharacterized protein (TIGR02246 family)